MDEQEFQRFYQEKVSAVYRYVYGQVGNREDAEDLTSEIFLKAVHSINLELGPQRTHKWLFLIARAIVADYWRAHYRAPISSLDELLATGWDGPTEEELTAIPVESADGVPLASVDRVQRLLQELPAHFQEVLTCRFLLNLSIKATALRMGVTVANVKVMQLRALKRAADLEEALRTQIVHPLTAIKKRKIS